VLLSGTLALISIDSECENHFLSADSRQPNHSKETHD
jgi:hypothetical protein